jgi:hypothetical protein
MAVRSLDMSSSARSCLVAVALFSFACGSSSTSDPTGVAGAAGSTGGGAGSSGGTAGAGGDPGVTAPIDPIVVGHSWTYDVKELGTYPACPSGEHTGTVLSQGPKDGEANALAVQSLCANAGTVYYTVAGDVVHEDTGGMWVLALDAPVEEGHSWTDGTLTYSWHDVGTVMVPAGTFPHCFTLSANVGASYTTFCRGVGPVHWYSVDAAGNGYEAILKAKNF